MHIANFTHPLTGENYDQIEKMVKGPTGLVYDSMVQFDFTHPLLPQIEKIVKEANIDVWTGMIVNLPGYAVTAALVMQELQKRSEYFFVLQLRSVNAAFGTKFEVAGMHRIQGFLGIRTE